MSRLFSGVLGGQFYLSCSRRNWTVSSSIFFEKTPSKISEQVLLADNLSLAYLRSSVLLSWRTGHRGSRMCSRVSTSRLHSSQIPEFVGKKCRRRLPQRYLPLIILATVTVYMHSHFISCLHSHFISIVYCTCIATFYILLPII